MHTPQEIGIDDFQASRSPTKMYRTAPLKGLFTHEKGASITTVDSQPSRPWLTTTTISSKPALAKTRNAI